MRRNKTYTIDKSYKHTMQGKLILKDGSKFDGRSFGYPASAAGEVVFTTGMVGYPESLTDPSYAGQILIFTYPLIGNYGVPTKEYWESPRIRTTGIIVSSYVNNNTHYTSERTFSQWLRDEKIPALEIKDTRLLTQKIREKGVMLGKIVIKKTIPFFDPNRVNLVNAASVKENKTYMTKNRINKTNRANSICRVVLIDCGVKQNIIRSLVRRGITVTVVPWDYNVLSFQEKFDGVVISNGPGDPKQLKKTIRNVKKLLQKNIPTLGICLGNQIMTLAAGGDTFKMKFGHRSQNQPVRIHPPSQDAPSSFGGLRDKTNRFFLTTQNHGFAVGKIPHGFKEWFSNANDGTNEGIIHESKPFMSVQFHPEACPGPTDTGWVFDEFMEHITRNT